MKRRKGIVFCLLLVCAALAAGRVSTPEQRTIRYFDRHRTALEEDALRTVETGRVSGRAGITVQYWDGAHPVVEYVVVSRGIVSASKYYGFFYSPEDEPVSFQNTGEPLTGISAQESEWHGQGDDYGMVRRLDTNWFYFEASL